MSEARAEAAPLRRSSGSGTKGDVAARRCLALVGLCLLGTACAPGFKADEPWPAPPAVRVAVVISGGRPTVRALDAVTPLDISLGDVFDRGEAVSVFMLGYSDATLRAHLPALFDHPPEELAALLRPVIVGAGESARLPAADAILCATFDRGSAHEVSYQTCSWEDWLRAGIGLRLDVPAELACGGITVDRLEADAGVTLAAVAAASSTTTFLIGTNPLDVRLVLYRVIEDRLEQVAVLDLEKPLRGRVSWDPQRRSLWGVADSGGRPIVFQLDGAGRRLAAPPLPFPREVWAGRDGTVVAEDFYLFELRGGAWVERRPVENQPAPILMARVVNHERLFFLSACWIHVYSFLEGAPPPREIIFDTGGCFVDGHVSIRDVAADEKSLVVVGDQNRISMIDDPAGERVERSGDLGQGALFAAAALGQARYLVGGAGGALALWTGSRWCPLAGDPGITFTAASTPGDEHTAMVIGNPAAGSGARSVVLRVRVAGGNR